MQVSIGQYISEALPTPLNYITPIENVPSPDVPVAAIVPVVVVVLLLGVLLVFSLVCWYHRKVRVLKGELGWTNVINQMELSKLQREREFCD